MASFKRTTLLSLPRGSKSKATADSLYWGKLTFPVVVKEVGQIDYLDFNPDGSSYFAATCSSKIQLYSSASGEVVRTFSKFNYAAYGGKFRRDGRLLVSGSDEGLVKLFDVQSKSLLRSFTGHNASTHRCDFAQNGTRAISFSDDKSAILWDISTEKQLVKFDQCHQDYIRSGLANPATEEIFLSGSYDHKVKLLDARTGKAVMSVNHGAPVEAVLMFPSGSVFISAGGDMVKVWSVVGAKQLAQMMQHHKTVTCLCFAQNHERLLSGSLDRHVKFYDTNTYEVVHTLDYPSAVLSIAVSQGDKDVVAGMADGLISIRRRPPEDKQKAEKKLKSNFHYRVYGTTYQPSAGDVVVQEEMKKKIPKYDYYLRTFQCSKALDCVLSQVYVSRMPRWTVCVLLELIRRDSLKSALAGRDEESLTKILRFVIKFLPYPDFTRVLLDVADTLVDVYTPLTNCTPNVQKLFKLLQETVSKELVQMKEMFEIQGALETLLASAALSNHLPDTQSDVNEMTAIANV